MHDIQCSKVSFVASESNCMLVSVSVNVMPEYLKFDFDACEHAHGRIAYGKLI